MSAPDPIAGEAEYAEAVARLEAERAQLAERREKLEAMGLAEAHVERALAPLIASRPAWPSASSATKRPAPAASPPSPPWAPGPCSSESAPG